MRICSFLPSATEMVCALGLETDLVGITHECDYPPTVSSKPVIVKSVVDTSVLAPAEVDRIVSERLRAGESLYEVDVARLKEAKPDLIITQTLCDVCAPSKPQAAAAIEAIPGVQVLYLTPHSLEDVWNNL